MKQAAWLILTGLLTLAAGIGLRHFLYPPPATEALPLPQVSLPDLTGNTRSFSDWPNHILIINFWASWCPSCREEMPELAAVQAKYHNADVKLIGIAVEEKEAVENYLRSLNINYPTLIAGPDGITLTGQFGNHAEAIPFTVVADREGIIRFRHLGKISQAELVSNIETLLQ